jgi:hypothetical protein
MITLFENAKEIKNDLFDIIKSEQESYGKDSGYYGLSDEEITNLVTRFYEDITDEEVIEFKEYCEYEDNEEAVFNLLNEWAFNEDNINK